MSTIRVLVADDDARLLEAIAIRLRAEGYEVVAAYDAIQAVRFARERPPDLVLLDINMPAGDGFTVFERIREIDGLDAVPVVFVTGDRSASVRPRARALGAADLLFKPLETGVLLDAVRAAVGDVDGTRRHALDALQQAADEWSARSRGLAAA